MGIPMPYDRAGTRWRRSRRTPSTGCGGRNAPWLLDEPRRTLAERLGVPVLVENDANLGALGEAAFGAGKGLESLIYVKLAEGIGAGVVIDGRIHRGSRGLAGELAHVRVRDDGELCVLRRPRLHRHRLQRPRHRAGHPAGVRRAADVRRRDRPGATEREPAVVRILSELGRTIGRVLADLSILLDPAGIVHRRDAPRRGGAA